MSKHRPKYLLAKQLDLTTNDFFQQNPTNVFNLDLPKSTRPKQCGALYGKDGLIITSSIVGKPEWFTRVQESKVVVQNLHIPESLKASYRGSIMRKIPNKTNRNQEDMSLDSKLIQEKGVKKEIIPKNKLLAEMRLTKDRCIYNQAKNKEILVNQTPDVQNYFTREERSMFKFDQTLQKWQEDSLKLSKKVGRDPNKTLVERSQEYRKRVEDMETFQLVETDEQCLANRHWYLKLRNYTPKIQDSKRQKFLLGLQEHKIVSPINSNSRFIQDTENLIQNDTQQLADIFSDFNTRIIYNPHKQVEVVRRTRFTQGSIQSPQTLYSKSFFSSVQSKMSQFNDSIQKKRANITDDIGSMFIEGESVYDKEFNSLLNDGEKGNKTYVKSVNVQTEQSIENEENWQMKELSKKGNYFYPAILKLFE